MATATTPEQVHARFLSALEQVGPAKVLAQVGHGGPSTEKEFIKGLRSGDERARLVIVERLPRARNPKLACELALAVVRCPELHAQEPLMLICLRELVKIGSKKVVVLAEQPLAWPRQPF